MIWWILVDSIIWLCIPAIKNYFACKWMDEAYNMTENFAVCLIIAIYLIVVLDHANEGRYIMIDLVIGIIQASIFVFAAFIFGYTKGMNEKATDEVKRLQRAAVEEANEMKDAAHRMDRLTNVIMASVARNHSNTDYPIDELATSQILRRVSREGYIPDDDPPIAEEDPLHWGRWLSHPDESGYITPTGLTPDKEEADRWRVIGTRVNAMLNELQTDMNRGHVRGVHDTLIPQMVITSIDPTGNKRHNIVKPRIEPQRNNTTTHTTDAEFDL